MTLAIAAEKPPLHADEHGVLRVGGTRVTLDSVIAAFSEGCTPEEIVSRYDSLSLDDVYTVVGYYLRHRDQIAGFLAERGAVGEQHRARAEQKLSWSAVRERLLAREHLRSDAPPRS